MMTTRFCFLVLLASFIIAQSVSAGDFYRIEFASNFGSTENLVDDSSGIYDAYNNSTLRLSFHPYPSLQIGCGGQYSYYRERIGLSSITGQAGFTLIPTPRTSPLAIYISGTFSGIRYHDEFNGFDNNIADLDFAAGYNLSETISIRGGLSYTSTSYISLEMDRKKDIEYYWGGNITLPGSIGFEIESGFARMNYNDIYADTTANPIFNIYPPDSLPSRLPRELWIFYWSPRISRLIAPKTGLNVVFTGRLFQNYDNEIVSGFSTKFLSPWASVWEGQSITTSLKSYLIPRLIFTAGAGYWDKTFLKTAEERHQFYVQLLLDRYNRRHDWQTRYYCSFQWPITTHSGIFVEPSVRLDYTKNISTEPLFNYNDYTFSTTVTVRL